MNADFHIAAVVSLLALVVIPGAMALQDASGPPQIRIESALVTVPVIVHDLQGRFLHGLRADEFELYQDGTPEKISFFLTSEDPIKIALLLDTSRSTMTVLDKIKKAAGRFLEQMRPQDLATVVSFDSEIQMLCPLSSDIRELDHAIKEAKAGGMGTRLRDSILEIAEGKFRSISGRKAMVLLTDGEDHGSVVSAPDLLDRVASSSTLIYPVFYHVDPRQLMKELIGPSARLPRIRPKDGSLDGWQQREEEAAAFLKKVSELSAGRFYRSDVTELDSAFKQISDELRSQYLIGFYPGQFQLDGRPHALEVRVKTPNTVVRGRRSYRAVRN